ncbi:hypothetical protein K437DRAFT_257492 [Tilletiaria anomala UBC 951]|uniref:Uncharacterized protein n=1 Tax=Tilletiaria anomala (strain ATCC 24038 / CBS 436.72 / UBC 951) TaxID=1037660 RepID=A0A066VNY1_TILAU|nr:uncharacterized protein K437DRAFT_257492 [Tilletiaria anomala UBC 951]KDN43432.1 hypothetical protein K437DRAFT_257492 [Tilletiaria anomala UBC 951]
MPALPTILIGRPRDPKAPSAPNSLDCNGRRHDQPSSVQPHLMPFTISYSGPAPVGPFMVMTPAPVEQPVTSAAIANEAALKAEQGPNSESLCKGGGHLSISGEECYESAFRGRGIHGTPLSLPPGWTGVVLDVPVAMQQLLPTLPRDNPAQHGLHSKRIGSGKPRNTDSLVEKWTSPRKEVRKKGPTVPTRFAIDSDSDSDTSDREHQQQFAPSPSAPKSPPIQVLAEDIDLEADWPQTSQRSEGEGVDGGPVGHAESAAMRGPSEGKVMSIVGTFDRLLVWSPDGLVDKGDDVYFRTLTEWQNVVVNTVHQH